MPSPAVIEINHITKKFKSKTVINDLSLSINPGEVFGLMGPNGSGKTTLINILLGLLAPDQGTINFFGKDLQKNLSFVQSRINMASTYHHLQDEISILDNLITYARLYGVSDPLLTINKLLNTFDFKKYINQDRKIATLSSGENARLMFCKALINNPQVLFLDEPTASLDPSTAKKIRNLIASIHQKTKTTIVMASHNLEEINQICTRVAFIKNGCLVKVVPSHMAKSLLSLY